MIRRPLAIVLACLLFAITSIAQAGPRDAQWKEVEEAVQKGLPKTAIEKLEPIIEGALKDKAYAEAVKAISQKIALEGNIQGNKPEEKVTRMQAEIAKAPAEMKPVMEAILANWYCSTDIENTDWELRESGWRVQVEGDTPLDVNITFPVAPEDYAAFTPGLTAHRAVNAVAGHAKYPGDLIIIDFGTATTLDVVDFNGAYKGGIIAPGINLSLDALVGNTAKLPRIAIEVPATKSVIGTNTEDQMLIGVFWGYVAMMEGLIARMRSEIGRPARVIGTGGLAVLFDEASDIFDAVDSDLTLDGLAILAERAEIT